MAFYAEPPPRHGVEGLRVAVHLGRPGLDGQPGRPGSTSTSRCRSTRCTSASWRTRRQSWRTSWPTSSPAYLAGPRLHPRRADAGDAAPVRRLVGLPRDVVLRAGRAVRRPRRLPAARRPAAPGRHRRDPGLGARRTSRPTSGRWPRFDGTPLYEDPNPQRGWHQEWGSHIFNFGRREVRNFLYANALYWTRGVPRRRAARRRRSPRCSTSTTPARPGEWTPEHARRPREPRGRAVPPGDERHRLQADPRRRPRSPRSRPRGRGVTGPTSTGGLGFGFKWNMGWMHDSLGYLAARPGAPRATTTAR